MVYRVAPIAIVILSLHPAYASADQCRWSEHAEGKSGDGRFVVRLDREDQSWKGRLEDTSTGRVVEAGLEGLVAHAHFSVLVSDDGSRVVVFEPRVDNHREANLLVYDRDLKRLKGFTLQELLTDIDRRATRRSVSHCEFVRPEKETRRTFWLEDGGKTFAVHLRSHRTALVSLAEPKIIPTPDVEPEVFAFEEESPPGKTDRERIAHKWMVTDRRRGVFGVDTDELRESPTYYTFEGDKLVVSSENPETWVFVLDESDKPRAIDLVDEEGRILSGIYEFRGGKLLVCFANERGGARPTTLDGEGFDAECWTITLQRRKP